jgi:predicted Rossmann-fold nucleotide-binding protein
MNTNIFVAIAAALLSYSGVARCAAADFDPQRSRLCTQQELSKGFDADSEQDGFDRRVYEDYISKGEFYPAPSVSRTRGSHDEGMAEALRAYVRDRQQRVVGVMGSGNSEIRCKPVYEQTVRAAWKLAHEGGYLIATGGGPGQMEAANLGAYLADEPIESIDRALEILRRDVARDPTTRKLHQERTGKCKYADRFAYTSAANSVIAEFKKGHENLGVPTWFYGDEATNVFATQIAKFFSNGIREDLLVTIPVAGILVVPGGPGTRQEIFMDMTQNYYGTFCYRSPTIFLGAGTYGALAEEKNGEQVVEPNNPGIYALVHKLTAVNERTKLLLTDQIDDIVPFFRNHAAERVKPEKPECANMP